MGMKTTVVQAAELQVASWSPGAADEGIAPTQVHILVDVPEHYMTFLIRLKSKGATEELITALIEHRDHVWGTE